MLFVVDLEGRRFRIGGNKAWTRLPDGAEIAVTTVEEVGSLPGQAAIAFLGNGSSTGGTLRLASGPAVARISVDWLTGRARREE